MCVRDSDWFGVTEKGIEGKSTFVTNDRNPPENLTNVGLHHFAIDRDLCGKSIMIVARCPRNFVRGRVHVVVLKE